MERIIDNLENLLPILVFVVVVVSSWLTKKRQGERAPGPGEDGGLPTSTPTPRPTAQTSDWEEELRRLLEGEQPAARPKPMPPPIVTQRPAGPPPSPPVSRPVPARPPAPRPPPVGRPPVPAMPEGMGNFGSGPLAHLTQSSQAYERASQLQERVGQRLTEVAKDHQHYYRGTCHECRGKIEFPLAAAGTIIACPHCGKRTLLAIDQTTPHLQSPVIVGRPGGAKEAKAAVGLLREPASARQAMIISFILAPPKSLES